MKSVRMNDDGRLEEFNKVLIQLVGKRQACLDRARRLMLEEGATIIDAEGLAEEDHRNMFSASRYKAPTVEEYRRSLREGLGLRVSLILCKRGFV